MNMPQKKLICLAVVAGLVGCQYGESTSTAPEATYSPVAQEGKTLITSADVITKGKETTQDTVTVTLGATSDLHGRLFGYDYAMDREDNDAGVTRVATLLKEVRAENPNIIMIDIGDTVQGNSAQLFNDQPTHPVVSALNSLDYDVWVPGNHEFNFERSFIDRNLAAFDGSVVSSNIKWESNDLNYIRAFQMFNVEGVKVAVVGLTPSNVPNWEASAPNHFAGLKFENELSATQEAVDKLVAEYQPDVIVGALHIERENPAGAGVYQIASAMADKFDVIFAGHEHATYIENIAKDSYTSAGFKGTDISAEGKSRAEDKGLAGVYDESNRNTKVKIIEPGKWGAALAKAEIKLKKNNGKWEMVDTTLANLSTKKVKEDVALQDEFRYVDTQSKEDARTPLGTVTSNFTPTATGFADAVTGEAFNPNTGRLYSTIHMAKVADTPLIDFINQIQISKTGAEVSAASLFSDQSNLVDGEQYTKGKSTNLYKYDNTLLGVNMKGAKLKEFMEWSYSYFNGYTDGDLTVSFRKGAKAYNYDQFDGAIQYKVDLAKPAGERIIIESISGNPFDSEATYKVAVNNYRYGTHLKRKGWATDADIYYESTNEPVYAIRDMLTDYVAANKGINVDNFDDNKNWSFVQDAAFKTARTDGGKGQALWNKLQNKEVCVQIDWKNAKYPGIAVSLNPNNPGSYYANSTKDDAGCTVKPQ
ncbi:5'-nucleotidase C-terminal domain-containing protein [Vibrio sp. JC009]|uniref:bifunctional metallophosphatase/5'-nucleotidase n=1 Tax=Vibrio sp. JC009 TaxID=2912314 RepID=UPI0023B0FD8C|nr:5'-nucleotidase C-terminal domain-containing protein [Vibrio sp. JC009]WED24286.1 5'-nucleotidase C-terminal domain-containing protein [Vibrio sp. JC009]